MKAKPESNRGKQVFGVALIGAIIITAGYFSFTEGDKTPATTQIKTYGAPALFIGGDYKGNGNVYSPEIYGGRMYFSGWYRDGDYPYDAIYISDYSISEEGLKPANARVLLQIVGIQLGDPSISGNKMYMTYASDPTDLTTQKIAVSTTKDWATWSEPKPIINTAWLPSAITVGEKEYVYYTHADGKTNKLMRVEIGTAIKQEDTDFDASPYPVNVDVQYYNGVYYLLGDYIHKSTYSIGMWTSTDGLRFTPYKYNPIITPKKGNIIARTPNFIMNGTKLQIWYAQQGNDWWTNNIYYKEQII